MMITYEDSGTAPDDLERSRYWQEYFERRHAEAAAVGAGRSLDYPNDKIRFQIYAQLFEAAGPLDGKSVLDVGCGWGTCGLICEACGAAVTAVDIVPATIAKLAAAHPGIRWRVVDVMNRADLGTLPNFDCIIAAEMLQHVDVEAAITNLWPHLRPGGRLIGSIPNSECPIIKKVMERYERRFVGASPAEISRVARGLPQLDDFWIRTLSFQSDQAFVPYRASEWTKVTSGGANRVIFCLLRDQTN